MKRIRLEGPDPQPRAVVTVGSFDGLHVGHRAVIEKVRSIAKDAGGTSVVVTFDPHPRQVIDPATAPPLLSSLAEKTTALERIGVDVLAVVPFTNDLRQLSPEAFVERFLLDHVGAQTVVLGYDHGFGKDRSGDLDTVKALAARRGFEVVSVPPTLLDGSPVSSTRVRGHIDLGEMEAATKLLGEPYPVSGRVEQGDGRGRQIGFPTANLALESTKLLPPDGVYAGRADADGIERWPAVVNLGTRPTFDGRGRRFEAHLIGYSGDLYGKDLTIAIESRLRPERKFDGVEQLKAQITEDIEEAGRRLDEDRIPTDAHNRSTDGG